MKRRAAAGCALALAVCVGTAACGKKGPPVAPNIRIPAAVQKVAAARVGNDVYVTVTVPATNIDESIPVDLQRIDIYAYTGRTVPAASRFTGLGTLVASIPVAPTPPTDDDDAPPAAPDPSLGAIPGSGVTIVDTLDADEFVQGPIYVDPRRPDLPPATTATDGEAVLHRFYAAVPFSLRGRPGPPGAVAELVLTPLPDAPTDLRIQYDSSAISLAWQPSGGIIGFLLDRALPVEPPPFVAAPQPAAPAPSTAKPDAPAASSGPTTYNLYRQLSADPLALPLATKARPWNIPVPVPINATPLALTSATDPLTPGREHCYVVRAQRGSILSAPSSPACITPIDVFPPAAPTGLAAVPSEGGISLIWEPGGEADLGGYLVLRREAGDDTLRQLTAAPVGDARYRDTDVQPGKRYVYSVVAVDTRVPLPNVSAESARVEETAR